MKKYVHLTNGSPYESPSSFNSVLMTLTFFCLNSILLLGCEEALDLFQSSPQTKPSIRQESTCSLPNLEHYDWWEGEWLMAPSVFEKQIFNTLSTFNTPTPLTNAPLTEQQPLQQEQNKGKEDHRKLKKLSYELAHSLSEQFMLKVESQFAYLKLDHQEYRLAMSPLESQNGIRLLGSQISAFLWCEGPKMMFSFGQLPFLVVKKNL